MKKIENVFSVKKWECVQDSLAEMTGMAILMVDYRGIPITKHSGCCDFCQKIRNDSILKKYCERCDSRGGAEAVRQNSPYIYKCCFGLIDVAIPIVLQNVFLGSLMVGQVKAGTDSLEKIVSLPINTVIEERLKQMNKDYQKIPVLEFDKIKKITYTLQDICNYIVEMENEENAKEKGEIVLIADEASALTENKIILRAKEYVKCNLENNMTLAETAKYCNVSASYLSRLFMKETGESFSVYSSRVKIEKAKKWLEENERSVSEIGYELGFNETGYFIKIFKKNVGMTPGMYRKYRKNVTLQKKSKSICQNSIITT